jgi:hypothetical protein
MSGTTGIEARLEALEAHIAIGQLTARYALGADRNNDPAILAPLFAPDATWEAPGMVDRLHGREQIATTLATLGRTFILWSLHFMLPPIVDVRPDRKTAQCRWYLWELCTMKGEDGIARDTWLGGWYDAQVERSDEGWLFRSVVLDLRLVSPAAAAWTGKKTNAL